MLPREIAIYNFQPVDNDFHARFSAIERRYRYHIITKKSPLRRAYAYYHPYPFDRDVFKTNMEMIKGTHDFSAFCATGFYSDNRVCTVTEVSIEEERDGFIFVIAANRFVYKMVRGLTGTLLDIAGGKISYTMSELLTMKDRSLIGRTAGPSGLVLDLVKYSEVPDV